LLKWTSEREETRLAWPDLDFDGTGVHLALQAVIIGVWFKPSLDGGDQGDQMRLSKSRPKCSPIHFCKNLYVNIAVEKVA
jgi:hypothetical protein